MNRRRHTAAYHVEDKLEEEHEIKLMWNKKYRLNTPIYI